MEDCYQTVTMVPLEYPALLSRIDEIDPVAYAATRNYVDGAVTRLSPYISRGVISTSTVYQRLLANGWTFEQSEKLVQELAWRDYWQSVWEVKGSRIDSDMNGSQECVRSHGMPIELSRGGCGIYGIDSGVKELLESGYIHNHQRMYIASLVCNIANCHWLQPAKWLYYHLLDGDWASNALSWQWVAGTFSSKKYYANQENINRYTDTDQRSTILDVAYDQFPLKEVPESLLETSMPSLPVILPEKSEFDLKSELPLLIHTSYNLDPMWKKGMKANRVLLLEPSHFQKYPVSANVMRFILTLADRIEDSMVFVGEFDELLDAYAGNKVYFKRHPFSAHFKGMEEQPERLTPVQGFYPSFFKFWKLVKKELQEET